MNKITDVILAQYKKANTKSKANMLKKFSFDTEKQFFEYCKAGKDASQGTDMVVAFDTTGSMSSYIGAVRKHVETLIPDMFENIPNLKMKIVAFGDYCDMPSKDVFGKAYQESNFTDDQEHLKEFVNKAKNTGGGDSDEFYELVIKKITEETPWRENTKKVILLIADDNPHPIGYTFKNYVVGNQIDWRVEAAKAKTLGIQIDTLRIHEYNWYKELSDITGGACVNFQTSEKTHNLVKMSALSRGATYSTKSKGEYLATYRSAVADGDKELVGAMKVMAETNSINLDE
jgi:hypothetical protein